MSKRLTDMQFHVMGIMRTRGHIHPYGLQTNSCKALLKRGWASLNEDGTTYSITPAGYEVFLDRLEEAVKVKGGAA
jgi:hypothetical protein